MDGHRCPQRKAKKKGGQPVKRYKCCGCIARNVRTKKPPFQAQRTDSTYLQHAERLWKIEKVIDTDQPPIVLNCLTKTDCVKNDLHRIMEIHRENKNLLTRINAIQRSKGVVDSYNPQAGIRCTSLGKFTRILDKIDAENKGMYLRLQAMKPTLKNSYLKKCWLENLAAIEGKCKYPLILPGICPADHLSDYEDCMDQYRPKAYLDIGVKDGRSLGRIVVLLFPDIVPTTTRNFMQLIHNYKRNKKAKERALGEKDSYAQYVGSRVHSGLYIEMGDITKDNGMGGESAFGADFAQENFIVEAKYPGMLGMIPDSEGKVNSKFLMTLKPLKVLNGKRVMFGRIIQGLVVIDIISSLSRPNGAPKEHIIIRNCGLLPPSKII